MMIVTCIQERWDLSVMVVRIAGRPVARLIQDSKNTWKVLPLQTEMDETYPTLTDAVDAIVAKHQP